jgi:hypothetical protein
MKQQTHTNIKHLSDRGLTSGVLNFNDSLKSHQYKTSGIIVILLKAVSKFDRSRSYENVIVYLFGTCIENKSTGIYHHMILWRKIVIFHTEYPKNFRASLRSAQFF